MQNLGLALLLAATEYYWELALNSPDRLTRTIALAWYEESKDRLNETFPEWEAVGAEE